ncbi:MAG: hypothetical protein ACI9HK_001200 [Pirellulaceae bacterium]|jgi:hypothetical protein
MKKGPTRLLGSGQVPVDEVLTSERRSALTRSMSIVVKLPRKGATTTVKHLMIHMLWHIYLLFNRQNTPIRKFTEQEREAAIASTDVNTLHNAVYVKTTPNQTDVTNRTLASAEAGQLFASVLSSAADVSEQGKIISNFFCREISSLFSGSDKKTASSTSVVATKITIFRVALSQKRVLVW